VLTLVLVSFTASAKQATSEDAAMGREIGRMQEQDEDSVEGELAIDMSAREKSQSEPL